MIASSTAPIPADADAPPLSPDPLTLFLRLRRHLTLVHEVPGRVRLRIGLGAVAVVGGLGAAAPTLRDLEPLFAPGTVRLNAGARSVVITHDPARFPSGFWRDCLDGSDETARARLAAAFPNHTSKMEII